MKIENQQEDIDKALIILEDEIQKLKHQRNILRDAFKSAEKANEEAQRILAKYNL